LYGNNLFFPWNPKVVFMYTILSNITLIKKWRKKNKMPGKKKKAKKSKKD